MNLKSKIVGGMSIQSLSIAVPAGCANECHFCVSKLHTNNSYPNLFGKPTPSVYQAEYMKRLLFARDHNCKTLIYTGTGEPLANPDFINSIASWNRQLPSPFEQIELQTSGLYLDSQILSWLKQSIAVRTISLSLSSIWSSKDNAYYNRTPQKLQVNVERVAELIKQFDFQLRLSLNLTDHFSHSDPEELFARAKILGADQVTFRHLYRLHNPQGQKAKTINDWITKHACNSNTLQAIKSYVQSRGTLLDHMIYGAERYCVDGISTVIDNDSMGKKAPYKIKYLVLRPNAKAYSSWDNPESLIL